MGAPSALQIADRWHLIQNLATALEPVVRRLERALKPPTNTEGKKRQEKPSLSYELRLTPTQQQRREQVHEQFRLVESLYRQGRHLREIASRVQIDKNTLRYFIQSQPWADTQPRRGRNAGESNLAPYLPYLHKRWKAGCQNGLQLWRELCARGYTGSASSVRPYVALLRQVPDDLLPPMFSQKAKPAPEKEPFSVRRIIWLALSREDAVNQRAKPGTGSGGLPLTSGHDGLAACASVCENAARETGASPSLLTGKRPN